MAGFVGPKDIFRNRDALFNFFEPQDGANQSPFDLHLTLNGEDFAIMHMHFKLGLYEHQSASAIHAITDLLSTEADEILGDGDLRNLSSIKIRAYETAFGIIGDPAKRNPMNRQSADHSMVYIIATLLRKALANREHLASLE